MEESYSSPGRLTDRLSIGILVSAIPRDIVDECVNLARRREKRSRLLPAHVVAYYVIALGLFFGEAYDEVMRRFVGGLRLLRGWNSSWTFPTPSAISQARTRLGEKPLELIFERAAVPLAKSYQQESWFHGRRIVAMDGIMFDAPATAENSAAFGHMASGNGPGVFPSPRVVALAECGTHAVIGAVIGSVSTGEATLAPRLLPRIEPDMLVLADRGFYAYNLWNQLLEAGAQTVFRASRRLVLPAIRVLPDGSFISVLLDSKKQSPIRKGARRQSGGDTAKEHEYLLAHGTPCRVVDYVVENSDEPYRLITSILDENEATALELAALYHQRWEIEGIFDEIETHQMGHGRVLRSKSPELVRQEIWGILLAHYAIRHLVNETADIAELDPDRLSFLRALRIIRRQISGRTELSPL